MQRSCGDVWGLQVFARRCRCWRSEQRGRAWPRSFVQTEGVDGENNALMQMFNQAFRPSKQSADRVKGRRIFKGFKLKVLDPFFFFAAL